MQCGEPKSLGVKGQDTHDQAHASVVHPPSSNAPSQQVTQCLQSKGPKQKKTKKLYEKTSENLLVGQ